MQFMSVAQDRVSHSEMQITGASRKLIGSQDTASVSGVIAVSGGRADAAKMQRHITKSLQEDFGYSREQAALLSLQIISEELKSENDAFSLKIGVARYREAEQWQIEKA